MKTAAWIRLGCCLFLAHY